MQNLLSNQKFHFLFLSGCWIVLQAFLLWHFGVVTDFEAKKYIEQAQLLLKNGSYESGNFLFYSTEILLIAAAIKMQVGFWTVVLVQLVTNAVSLLLFYRMVQQLTNHSVIALFASLLLLCQFYYQLYNVHLFTESLFFSFSVFYAFALFRVPKKSFLSIAAVLFLLTLLVFTRPTGVLLIPPTIFYFILRFGKKRTPVLLLISFVAGLLLFYFLLNAILGSGGELNFLLPYIEEHVICGVPTVQQPNNINLPPNPNSVAGLWQIISNNNALFLKLAGKRFLAFWGVQRPYYSMAHNVFVALYFYSLYALILFGVKRMLSLHRPEAIFLLLYIFLVMLTVLLSCDEWHSRFLYSLLPFLILLATGVFEKAKPRH